MSGGRIEKPAAGKTALIILDMINRLDFEGSEAVLPEAVRAAEHIHALRADADRHGVPTVYVNDNFGRWTSERDQLIRLCSGPDSPGREIVSRLSPRQDDFFVIKPMHSGFYATNLAVLLPKLGASRLILTGMAAEMCVLFTAADAHMRDYQLWVPGDCVAPAAPHRKDWALEIMAQGMGAQVHPTRESSLEAWLETADPPVPER